MLKSFSLLLALLFLACASAAPLPELQLFYGTAYQRCAEKDLDIQTPHSHLTFRAYAPKAQEGDIIRFSFGKQHADLAASTGVVTITYPAGIGGHTVKVEWLRGEQLIRSGEFYVSVWNCDPGRLN